MKLVFCLSLLCCIGLRSSLMANNIAVSIASLTGQNTTAGTNSTANFTMVKFDVSWDNSWRTSSGPSNWDAAWVFVKFRVGSSNPVLTGASSSGTTVTVNSTANLRAGMPVVVSAGTGTFAANTVISSISSATQFVVSATPSTALSNATVTCQRIWEHASLDVSGGHTAPSGSVIDVANDSTGVFIYRNADGTGSVNYQNVQLRWKYGINGVADDAVTQVKVIAIEMVNVPQGSFYLGSGGTEAGSFTDGSWSSGATIPYQITSEGALGIDDAGGKLWGTVSTNISNGFIGNIPADPEATLSASYPKGFNAFYCMKYEIGQGQYRDFLNSLTYSQQVSRTTSAPSDPAGTGAMTTTNLWRNGLDIKTSGDASTYTPAEYGCNLDGDGTYNNAADGEWIACNYLTWMDGCAYLDWAGLRPMTELEFEKACRGGQAAVANEYAWGTTVITRATGISSSGSNNESFSNAGANSNHHTGGGNFIGPLRVGAFAGGATTREQAGASYYGIMELSGNLYEGAVTLGNATGRGFAGVHGNGHLSANGHANQANWPGLSGNEVTGATGGGSRGGGWENVNVALYVSHRDIAGVAFALRANNFGFRGVRTSP
jgi:formylglycine-generating enzyme required for sulfatase activity